MEVELRVFFNIHALSYAHIYIYIQEERRKLRDV